MATAVGECDGVEKKTGQTISTLPISKADLQSFARREEHSPVRTLYQSTSDLTAVSGSPTKLPVGNDICSSSSSSQLPSSFVMKSLVNETNAHETSIHPANSQQLISEKVTTPIKDKGDGGCGEVNDTSNYTVCSSDKVITTIKDKGDDSCGEVNDTSNYTVRSSDKVTTPIKDKGDDSCGEVNDTSNCTVRNCVVLLSRIDQPPPSKKRATKRAIIALSTSDDYSISSDESRDDFSDREKEEEESDNDVVEIISGDKQVVNLQGDDPEDTAQVRPVKSVPKSTRIVHCSADSPGIVMEKHISRYNLMKSLAAEKAIYKCIDCDRELNLRLGGVYSMRTGQRCQECINRKISEAEERKRLEFKLYGNKKSFSHNPKKEENLKCEECNVTFCNKSSLKNHMARIHGGNKTWTCKYCCMIFNKIREFQDHKETHRDEEKPYKCKYCGRGFHQQGPRRQHEQAHRGEKPFLCAECGASFPRRYQCNRHMASHRGEARYKCQYCGRYFHEKKRCDSHVELHMTQSGYSCEQCPMVFSRKKDLTMHTRHHSASDVQARPGLELNNVNSHYGPTTQASCPSGMNTELNMETQFVLQALANTHEQPQYIIHTEVPVTVRQQTFTCEVCLQQFNEEIQLLEHMKTHMVAHDNIDIFQNVGVKSQGSKLEQAIVVSDGSSFSDDDLLSNDSSSNEGVSVVFTKDDRRNAGISGETVSSLDPNSGNLGTGLPSLDSTERSHLENSAIALLAGIRTFQCDICGLGFRCRRTLETHMLTHSDERPYKCDQCNKAFKTSASLQDHMKIHSGERPFLCQECGMSFPRKYHLNRHMASHRGEGQFYCPECNRRFCAKPRLNAHMILHRTQQGLPCSQCPQIFSRKKDRTMHMSQMHSGTKPVFNPNLYNSHFKRLKQVNHQLMS